MRRGDLRGRPRVPAALEVQVARVGRQFDPHRREVHAVHPRSWLEVEAQFLWRQLTVPIPAEQLLQLVPGVVVRPRLGRRRGRRCGPGPNRRRRGLSSRGHGREVLEWANCCTVLGILLHAGPHGALAAGARRPPVCARVCTRGRPRLRCGAGAPCLRPWRRPSLERPALDLQPRRPRTAHLLGLARLWPHSHRWRTAQRAPRTLPEKFVPLHEAVAGFLRCNLEVRLDGVPDPRQVPSGVDKHGRHHGLVEVGDALGSLGNLHGSRGGGGQCARSEALSNNEVGLRTGLLL
mmetsp:Transcript_94707/g.300512  ORF Transcript_94707/g.300512 Transcript_94707/m.300512 type:complete len:292 (-) Transcript_94707:437-1312(-)